MQRRVPLRIGPGEVEVRQTVLKEVLNDLRGIIDDGELEERSPAAAPFVAAAGVVDVDGGSKLPEDVEGDVCSSLDERGT